jgi:membrane-bound serine protease (ClpP class)
MVENIPDLLSTSGIKNYEIKNYRLTPLEKTIGFLLNPILHGILIMLIIGGIYFELQSPGIGFPLAASIIAAVLYFAPLYLEGLAQNWEMVLFAVGLVLIALEVFVVPGFGVTGISGIILVVVGLTLSMIDNVVFELDGITAISAIIEELFVVIFSVFISLFLSIYISKRIFSKGILSRLALDTVQNRKEGFISIDMELKNKVGKIGVATSILRPSGKIEIDGEYYDAKSEIGYIEKGGKVKVVRDEAGQLYVRKAE